MNLFFNSHRLALARLLLVCIAALAMGPRAVGGETPSLVVVTSRGDGPYEGVVSGVQGAFSVGPQHRAVSVHSLKDSREETMEVLRKARADRNSPVITVGSAATRAALKTPGKAPVVACMISDKDDLGGARNATGVVLEFPLETQLKWLQRFSPDSQAIGVLYNPAENSERVADATKIAKGLGLRLIAREVHRPQDLPAALDSLARDADLLFAVTDRTVLSRQTAQAILLFSFRNRMPFSGLSASWVKAGALYSLERDYDDLGAQCAEMAMEILKGKRASSLPPATPRKVIYALNLKTAEHLKLRLPDALVEGAAEVFR